MFKKIMALSAMALMAGCMSTTPADTPTAATPLLDKRLVSDGGAVFLINSDGTMGGEWRGQPIVGTYEATSTEICSVLTAPAQLAGERCSVPVIADGKVTFNRRDGSQSATYTIEG